MKMLFFSSDWTEVEVLRKEFLQADIPCEVRVHGIAEGMPVAAMDGELWIQNNRDWYRAAMLCVQLDLAFARPALPLYPLSA